MSRKTKRVVVVSDLHSGHKAGLTPPSWQLADSPQYSMQSAIWQFYARTIEALQPVDICLCLGDMIDGRGDKSGGVELITGDRIDQGKIAAEALRTVKAKKYLIIYGTPYHVSGGGEDWERLIADELKAEAISGHEWVRVNDTTFDLKHKVGSSQASEHTRFTPLARERIWNQFWHLEDGGQPLADILIRGHVHYHIFCGNSNYLAMTVPALQGYGSHYGIRQCSGTVHIGLVHFDIHDGGDYTWQAHIARGEFLRIKPRQF